MNKIYLLGQIDRHSLDFFSKTGQGGLSMADSNSLRSIIKLSSKKLTLFVVEISSVQNRIRSRVTPACLARRNTMYNERRFIQIILLYLLFALAFSSLTSRKIMYRHLLGVYHKAKYFS